jgi:hypothetical protein
MALFKNLYLDLSYLNPFKKKNKESSAVFTNQPANKKASFSPSYSSNPSQAVVSPVNSNPSFNQLNQVPIPDKKMKELPQISRRLLDTIKEAKEIKEPVDNMGDKVVEKPELPKISKNVIVAPPSISPNAARESNNFQSQNDKENENDKIHSAISKDSSFFNELYDHLSKDEVNIHQTLSNKVLNKDLLDEMQNFWHNKKDELNQTMFNQALKEDLMKKMNVLQEQEIEWQKMQLDYERLKDELASKEIIIENNIKHLKKSFKKLHLTSNINQEHYFILADGNKLRSLQELHDGLKTMDLAVYNSHVNEHKNDFANWVNDVMGLSELAGNMRLVKSKEQMHDLLENWSNSF